MCLTSVSGLAGGCRYLLSGQKMSIEWRVGTVFFWHLREAELEEMKQDRSRIPTIVLAELFVCDKMPNYRVLGLYLEQKASKAGLHVSMSLRQRDHGLWGNNYYTVLRPSILLIKSPSSFLFMYYPFFHKKIKRN